MSIQIETIGRIKTLTIPDGWLPKPKTEDILAKGWKVEFTSADDARTFMGIYYRGAALDLESVAAYDTICNTRSADNGAGRELGSADIVELRILMGIETCGNNQYTNPQGEFEPTGPVFDLQSAAVTSLVDKEVLAMKGVFRSGYHIHAIFYPADLEGRIIHEIRFYAPDADEYARTHGDFAAVLNSIVWYEPEQA